MRHEALLLATSNTIEEEARVRIGEHELCCFASRGRPAGLGRRYTVDLSLEDLGGWQVEDLGDVDVEPRVTPTGVGFGYVLVGRLDGARLDAGVVFEAQIFADEYAHLSGKTVRVHVDRIGIDFL